MCDLDTNSFSSTNTIALDCKNGRATLLLAFDEFRHGRMFMHRSRVQRNITYLYTTLLSVVIVLLPPPLWCKSNLLSFSIRKLDLLYLTITMSDNDDELLCDLYSIKVSRQAIKELDFIFDKVEKSVYICGAVGPSLLTLPDALRNTTVQVVSIDGNHIHNLGDIENFYRNFENEGENGGQECALILKAASQGSTMDRSGLRRAENIVTPIVTKKTASSLAIALKSQGTSISQSFSSPFHATGTKMARDGALPVTSQSSGTAEESMYSQIAGEREKFYLKGLNQPSGMSPAHRTTAVERGA